MGHKCKMPPPEPRCNGTPHHILTGSVHIQLSNMSFTSTYHQSTFIPQLES